MEENEREKALTALIEDIRHQSFADLDGAPPPEEANLDKVRAAQLHLICILSLQIYGSLIGDSRSQLLRSFQTELRDR